MAMLNNQRVYIYRGIFQRYIAHGISSHDLIQEEYNQQLEGLRSELEAGSAES